MTLEGNPQNSPAFPPDRQLAKDVANGADAIVGRRSLPQVIPVTLKTSRTDASEGGRPRIRRPSH